MRFKKTIYILLKLFKRRTAISFLILFVLLSTQGSFAQPYGLHFSGHEVSLDQRTQLYLTPDKPLPLSSPLELSFKLNMEADAASYFGYIFRMVLGDENIDLVHGFLPDRPDNFQLVLRDEEHSFSIPLSIITSEWVEFHFVIDIDKQKLTCNVLDISMEVDMKNYSDKDGFRLFFGAHTLGHFSTTDVCQMDIKDVKVNCADKKSYYWPLDQTEGNIVLEKNHNADGRVENPNWLIRLHNQWEKNLSFEIPGFVKTAFNSKDGKLYIASSKFLKIFDVSDHTSTRITTIEYSQPYKMLSQNNLIFDTLKNELICYSLDLNYLHHYNTNSRVWSEFPSDTLNYTTFWHHNKSITADGNLYTFGGYGEYQYKNQVYKWSEEHARFDTISTTGLFFPRYLAGGGYNPNDSLFYIIGGYGSKGGIQTVNPDYYYDILSYSFEDSSFQQVFEFTETDMVFCFAGSVVIDDSSNLYGLRFSKYLTDNELQLVKIPLQDPKIIELGSPIDFSFIDINSSAEFYYYPRLQKMLAVSTFLNENVSQVEVYSIAFPPQAYNEPIEKISPSKIKSIWFLFGGILAVIAAIIIPYVIRMKRKLASNHESVGFVPAIIAKKSEKSHAANKEISANSIILFGGFQIIDKDGKDITGHFTPLLKKLLLIIMLNSLKHNKGLSSNILYETFWFDKSIESARNNRAVNIVKLKSLLENVGTCTITKETGYWKFEMEQGSLYIDYLDYLNIASNKDPLSKEDVLNLLAIIERGAFLRNAEDEWLDAFKSDVSNDIIDKLAEFIKNSDSEPDFILQLTNCMFMFDMVSEEAMILQCSTLVKLGKHSLAKKAYEKFVKEYKLLYGEEYDKSFNSITADKKM